VVDELVEATVTEGAQSRHARDLRDAREDAGYGLAPWNPRFDTGMVEARRLFAELLGTFFLVLTGAGSAVVGARTATDMGRAAQVTAPGLMVMALILFMGRVSGAHLNPAVTIGFTARGDFPWRRVPGYVAAQLAGAALACLFLRAVLGRVGMLGATEPGSGISDFQGFLVELVLTIGLMSVILGTASSAQNVGPLAALAVGGYIVVAGLWSSPVTGASMNPARSFGSDLLLGDFSHYAIYVAGPTAGALVAVGIAYTLRGAGDDAGGRRAAQGEDDGSGSTQGGSRRP
jgi:aquaporin Z